MKGLLRDAFVLPLADNGIEVEKYFLGQSSDVPMARQGVHIVHQPVYHDEDPDEAERLARLDAAFKAWKKRMAAFDF